MATHYPVEPVVLPQDLVCTNNGDLPTGLLIPIGDRGLLHHHAAAAWDGLWLSGQRAGYDLTYTYGGTYRSLQQQTTLFLARWTAVPIAGRPTRFWNGTQWWLRRGVALAAVPGTSNHGLGLAVDIALGVDPAHAQPITPALGWLLTAAEVHGWTWEAQSEPWHLNFFYGDQLAPGTRAAQVASETQQRWHGAQGDLGFPGGRLSDPLKTL